MHLKRVLITGGAGFVGSNIAVALKTHVSGIEVVALDNLYRKGSSLNLPRLEKNDIKFIRGDVRNPQDLLQAGKIDFLIECSAEPSVLAGKDGDTDYLVQTNLYGAINCAEYCRRNNAGMIFLSTSRVYPIDPLTNCRLIEKADRLELSDNQEVAGLSSKGVSEEFPMAGARSIYGATKYSAEIMLEEYRQAFSIPIVIDRCGVIAGPWQFGKVDQGIAVFWLASHMFQKPLKYIGFGGTGKQVRDMMHIDDLVRLVLLQLEDPAKFAKGVWNAGGGRNISVSLIELTEICRRITGNDVQIGSDPQTRYADIPVYISDTDKINSFCSWKAEKSVEKIIYDIHEWLNDNPEACQLFK
ncbi:MAG TPA: 3-beta hydroxysteroid dehydrogenase [Lentisphaeria bacterium]|nr:MAG: 3-beta hydroxysteroid dehydrogenase [Lentisphaerae bacterium GWF2_50_93]HCE45368.1 3-beta hydroxysteroid dehydrogenase [Lentisphaeria bacterium]